MTQVAEYRDIATAVRSQFTVLATGTGNPSGHYPREFRLYHKTAGWEPAGSMARWTDERWGVQFTDEGATHGRMFLTLQEAITLFQQWTAR